MFVPCVTIYMLIKVSRPAEVIKYKSGRNNTEK
jgi:hypothetical protein